ncbi:hypothetical protein FWF48_02660 [Candidatus Saccharibacteria bacterium]|nr:hypothetical protein [Candidatus Saccharibacteria bacterium]
MYNPGNHSSESEIDQKAELSDLDRLTKAAEQNQISYGLVKGRRSDAISNSGYHPDRLGEDFRRYHEVKQGFKQKDEALRTHDPMEYKNMIDNYQKAKALEAFLQNRVTTGWLDTKDCEKDSETIAYLASDYDDVINHVDVVAFVESKRPITIDVTSSHQDDKLDQKLSRSFAYCDYFYDKNHKINRCGALGETPHFTIGTDVDEDCLHIMAERLKEIHFALDSKDLLKKENKINMDIVTEMAAQSYAIKENLKMDLNSKNIPIKEKRLRDQLSLIEPIDEHLKTLFIETRSFYSKKNVPLTASTKHSGSTLHKIMQATERVHDIDVYGYIAALEKEASLDDDQKQHVGAGILGVVGVDRKNVT